MTQLDRNGCVVLGGEEDFEGDEQRTECNIGRGSSIDPTPSAGGERAQGTVCACGGGGEHTDITLS